LLEAMAAGLPVVATSVGGNPEIRSRGKTGLLVPPRDTASLAQSMIRILESPELGRQYDKPDANASRVSSRSHQPFRKLKKSI